MVRLVCVQDPKDKRWANCDETLKKLTGEKRIKLFGGQKYFSKHIVGK
jgi:chromatin remodeling complex protein RSC6